MRKGLEEMAQGFLDLNDNEKHTTFIMFTPGQKYLPKTLLLKYIAY